MDSGRARTFDIGPLPQDPHARLIHLSNVFGRVLFDTARDPAMNQARSLPKSMRPEAERLVNDVLYAVVQVLDGVTEPITNDRLRVEIVLSARLRDKATGQVSDVVELGPNGEGLTMGFAGWVRGDFGTVAP
jgi:hypothetical protein